MNPDLLADGRADFRFNALDEAHAHPLLSEQALRYVLGSIKFVKQVLITTGSGWVNADPEIRRLKPDIYVVNEDGDKGGDKGGKREYCANLTML